jgi:FkbM family methyltransferase
MELENIFKEYNKNYLSEISHKLNKAEGVVIFGAGILGKKIANHLRKENFNILCFVDNNEIFWGNKIDEIPVISLAEASKKFPTSICIIAIWNPLYHYALIKKQLAGFEFASIVHAAQIMQLYSNDLLPHYHFQSPDFYFDNKILINDAYSLLNDEESKKQYLNHLKYRLQINFDCIPVPDTKNQYFPNDIIHLKENEVFLDAGAYDGDTFIEFSYRVNNKYDKYIALEPDPKNYAQIKLNLQNRINLIIDPYAVGAKHEFLKFSSTGGEGASINNDGDISVECVSIDEKYLNLKPTFLKFDIEGAELDALRGAINVIKEMTPTIAVCIYHKPQDIFEIPLWINEVNSNYNFYVRTHGSDGFEFVLYAIPKTKS